MFNSAETQNKLYYKQNLALEILLEVKGKIVDRHQCVILNFTPQKVTNFGQK